MNEFTQPMYAKFKTPVFVAVFPITDDKVNEANVTLQAMIKVSLKLLNNL